MNSIELRLDYYPIICLPLTSYKATAVVHALNIYKQGYLYSKPFCTTYA